MDLLHESIPSSSAGELNLKFALQIILGIYYTSSCNPMNSVEYAAKSNCPILFNVCENLV